MAEVVLDQMTKIYENGFEAVSDLDLDIADGEFLVLVGPSGCGKSTALRMVAGLEDITEGELRIGGRRVNEVPSRDRDIAMVFQSYALYPHMSVADNISFGLKLRKMPKDEIDAPRRRRPPRRSGSRSCSTAGRGMLSGGQRQRVAMGRAIVRNPQVFLMDEPLSNLDAKLRVQMRADIAAPAARARRHDHLRHPRPDRGDDDGRPGRRDAQGRAAAGRRLRRCSTTSRTTCSSPGSSVHRR